MKLKIKRVYEKPQKDDGVRVLVDRLWPRGISKEEAKIELWLKNVAPGAELRKWFGHDPEKWNEFKKRYFHELDQEKEAVETLRASAQKGMVTLLFGAKDEKHNNAQALMEYLTKK
jgi:uncharacterized protein YeaO (DUF488 family)